MVDSPTPIREERNVSITEAPSPGGNPFDEIEQGSRQGRALRAPQALSSSRGSRSCGTGSTL